MNEVVVPIFPERLVPLSEEEICLGWESSDGKPLVSICCATYNHAPWIEDAICGFLAQRTNFPFEIIIRDDASTDGTTDIVKDYAARYPRLIRHVLNEVNKFSNGERPSQAWPSLVHGKYMAFCEGDDFWIVNNKLQKQIDMLESNKNASMAVALTNNYLQTEEKIIYQSTTAPMELNVTEIVDSTAYYHTSTFVIRSNYYRDIMDKYFKKLKIFEDTTLRSLLITYGPFLLLPNVVSVYRITGKGVYSSKDLTSQLEWGYIVSKNLYEVLTGKYRRNHLNSMYGIAKAIAVRRFRNRDLFLSLWWGFNALWHGFAKIPDYINRRLNDR